MLYGLMIGDGQRQNASEIKLLTFLKKKILMII